MATSTDLMMESNMISQHIINHYQSLHFKHYLHQLEMKARMNTPDCSAEIFKIWACTCPEGHAHYNWTRLFITSTFTFMSFPSIFFVGFLGVCTSDYIAAAFQVVQMIKLNTKFVYNNLITDTMLHSSNVTALHKYCTDISK